MNRSLKLSYLVAQDYSSYFDELIIGPAGHIINYLIFSLKANSRNNKYIEESLDKINEHIGPNKLGGRFVVNIVSAIELINKLATMEVTKKIVESDTIYYVLSNRDKIIGTSSRIPVNLVPILEDGSVDYSKISKDLVSTYIKPVTDVLFRIKKERISLDVKDTDIVIDSIYECGLSVDDQFIDLQDNMSSIDFNALQILILSPYFDYNINSIKLDLNLLRQLK
jgi:hypothetical protein